jgi:hypothetical protein
MTTITFACPDCRTNLKTSRRITPDLDVRCPQCGTVFPAPPETNSDLLESPQGTTDGSSKEIGNGSEPATGLLNPAAKLGSPEAVTAGKRIRRMVLVSGVIVLVFTAATAYLAWSAVVNRGRNSGTGQEDPLAYVPAESTLVIGINLGELPDQPAWRELFEKVLRSFNQNMGFLNDCKTNTGVELSELFEQTILALKLDGLNRDETPHATLIAHSRTPFNQNKVRDSEEDMFPQFAESKSGRVYYYERNVNHLQDLNYLFMPSDRVLILSNLPQYEFEPLAEGNGTEPLLSAERATLIRSLQKNALWAVLPFSEDLRNVLHKYSQATVNRTPELALVLETLSRSHTAAAGGRWEDDKFVLTVDLVCGRWEDGKFIADEAAAEKALTTLRDYWEKHSRSWLGLLPMLPKDRQGLLQDLMTQTKFHQEGTAVRLTTRFTSPPAEALGNLLPGQPWIFWGAPERGAQPGIPPGRFPPGRRPPGFGPGGPNQPPPRKA